MVSSESVEAQAGICVENDETGACIYFHVYTVRSKLVPKSPNRILSVQEWYETLNWDKSVPITNVT